MDQPLPPDVCDLLSAYVARSATALAGLLDSMNALEIERPAVMAHPATADIADWLHWIIDADWSKDEERAAARLLLDLYTRIESG